MALNLTFWLTVVVLIISIVEMLRRKVLREKYAIVWLGVGVLLIFGAIFPDLVNRFSKFLGFQIFSNFVFFIFILINLLIAMQLSLSLGKTENQIQTLAEEVALLKQKLHKM